MRSLLVLVVAALLAAGCGDSPRKPVPEGGSGLREGLEPAPPRERSLIDALAALVERTAPERIGTPGRAGDAADRLPLTRAAAQVLLAGFRGTVPRAPFFGVLRERDLGGVVLERRNAGAAVPGTASAGSSPTGPTGPTGPAGPTGALGALATQATAVAQQAGHVAPLIALRTDGDAGIGFWAPADAHAAGVRLMLGPHVDIPVDANPRDIASGATELVAGWERAGVLAAPATFPGQGGATQDPLRGPASVGSTLTQLRSRDLVPFRALLPRAHAVVISNAAYAAWDGVTPAAQLPEVVDDLLRDDLHFRGVAIADDLLGASAATGQSPGAAAVAALKAGCDLLYVRDEPEVEAAYAGILGAVRRGELPEERLREAVRRVLALKRAARIL